MSMYIKLGSFDLTNAVYGGFQFFGGQWQIKQDGARSLKTGARKDVPVGAYGKFNVIFKSDAEYSAFMAYIAGKDEDANIPLFVRTNNWYFKVWGVQVTQMPVASENPMDFVLYGYTVTCYFYSPYTYSNNPTLWQPSSPSTLPQTSSSLPNVSGHYPVSVDDLILQCFYNAAHVKALTVAIGASNTLTITDESLSDETFELLGNDNRLLETYEDIFSSGTKMGHDSDGDGVFDTDHMKIDDDGSQIYILHGPLNVRYPVKMTANLALDAGGASGLAYVDISPDGLAWKTVLTQDMFVAGDFVYYLNGSEYIQDVYVRFRCESGTAGKYLKIYHLKFEAERWIPSGYVPIISAGDSQPLVIDCDHAASEKISIDCTFRPIRLWV